MGLKGITPRALLHQFFNEFDKHYHAALADPYSIWCALNVMKPGDNTLSVMRSDGTVVEGPFDGFEDVSGIARIRIEYGIKCLTSVPVHDARLMFLDGTVARPYPTRP
jgi:hypothetical protein